MSGSEGEWGGTGRTIRSRYCPEGMLLVGAVGKVPGGSGRGLDPWKAPQRPPLHPHAGLGGTGFRAVFTCAGPLHGLPPFHASPAQVVRTQLSPRLMNRGICNCLARGRTVNPSIPSSPWPSFAGTPKSEASPLVVGDAAVRSTHCCLPARLPRPPHPCLSVRHPMAVFLVAPDSHVGKSKRISGIAHAAHAAGVGRTIHSTCRSFPA